MEWNAKGAMAGAPFQTPLQWRIGLNEAQITIHISQSQQRKV